MTETETVYCPWCKHTFEIDVPPEEETIQCPKCLLLCDWWADGDMEPIYSYYLTQSPSKK